MSEDKVYNRERFNEMKTKLGLSNDDLAEIVNLKSGTVKNQVSPYSKKVSTWMRAFIYMFNRMESLEEELRETDAINHKMIRDHKRALTHKANKARV
jgi:hypothetical protein